jgi:8-oxo-dGTP diphosphatase
MDDIYKAGGILIRDKQLLFARSVGTEVFIDPGGKIEPGETSVQALVRELNEELGIVVHEEDIVFFDEFSAEAANHPGRTVHMKVFFVNTWSGDIKPSSEIEELRWLDSKTADSVKTGSIFGGKVLPKLHEQGLIN